MSDALQVLGATLAQALHEHPRRTTSPWPTAAQAFLALAAARSVNRTVVWVTDGPRSLETAHQDLVSLRTGLSDSTIPVIHFYPPTDTAVGSGPDPDTAGQRLKVLQSLQVHESAATDPSARLVVVTCIHAFMQKVLAPDLLQAQTLCFAVGVETDLAVATARLTDNGYEFSPQVDEKGQASLRGGILDVWPPSRNWPVRVEWSGSTVESIRSFDPVSQQSVERETRMVIPPAQPAQAPGGTGLKTAGSASLLAYLPQDTLFIWSDPEGIAAHAAIYEDSLEGSDAYAGIVPYSALRGQVSRRRFPEILLGSDDNTGNTEPLALVFDPLKSSVPVVRETLSPDSAEQARHRLLDDLVRRAASGDTVVLFFDTPGAHDHFQRELKRDASGLHLRVGCVSEGFSAPMLRLILVSESDLYGSRKLLGRAYDPEAGRARPDRTVGARLSDLSGIEPGDIVVHMEHGRGRYLGMFEIRVNNQLQEVLSIEYANGAKLHVPVSQAHLLSRYVGISRHHVELHKIGAKSWAHEKAAAEEAIRDMAAALLETQAQRNLLEGHAFAADTPWQRDFEAAFPYRETEDQQRAIADVKRDMESIRPMDRLVCGDAGYGKTEVAMRAAFKAVQDNMQVAVLVPTTILAQQHFQTFSERLAAFPFRVEMLSRFQTRGERAAILRDIAAGHVDIVIGTHALLQPGVAFQNLGLVITDEEQRFGVAHKEALKQLRRMVDILTLTATPIPRTLYMGMIGIREMSLIQSPPRERLAVETIIARNTDDVIRDAIQREVSRGGQVFYLHNRVMTIEHVRQRLERVVPGTRIEIAHGQMPSSELSQVMKRFVAGEFDVLLCTTIIESGTDIPRANTILIDRADRFGMADLYQLRGRVGRASHKGYAYLLLPAHGHIDPSARRRIGAIRKFSSLSVGFKLALRDLEIRGAGNLLGSQQSGHINNVGFSLYCQLLKRTVSRMRNEAVAPLVDVELLLDFVSLSASAGSPDRSAVIPFSYIEDERIRVGVYRRIAESASEEDVSAIAGELADRFGPPAIQVQLLLQLARLRVLCAARGIQRIETRDGRIMITRNGQYHMKDRRFPRLAAGSAAACIDQIHSIVRGIE